MFLRRFFFLLFFSDSSVLRFPDNNLRRLLLIIFKIGTLLTGGKGKIGIVDGLSMLSVVRSVGQRGGFGPNLVVSGR